MRAYILYGNLKSKDEYVEKFISENNIKPYLVFKNEEPLKIADVREINRKISAGSFGGARLFVISGEIKPDAQNALLKTLEELPEDADVVFLSGENLLPTVVSRCTVVKLNIDSKAIQNKSIDISNLLLESGYLSVPKIIPFVDEFFSASDVNNFEEFILQVRKRMIDSIVSGEYQSALVCCLILEKLTDYSSLVASNNLNPKNTVERLLIALA